MFNVIPITEGSDNTTSFQNCGESINSSAPPSTAPEPSISVVIPLTYAELAALATGDTLVPGQVYKMTDFQTIYTQPISFATKTGATEELLLIAATGSTFFNQVKSVSRPTDHIEYSLTTPTHVAEFDDIPRKGWITFRRDAKGNEAYEDFVGIRYIRYKVLKTYYTTLVDGLNLPIRTIVYRASDDSLYVAHKAITSTSGITGLTKLLTNISTKYWMADNYDDMVKDNASSAEFPLFDYTASKNRNNKFPLVRQKYLNTVVFGTEFYNNLFQGDVFNNTIDTGFTDNIIMPGDFNNNIFDAWSQKSIFGGGFRRNVMNGNMYSNTFLSDFRSNKAGSSFQNNDIKSNVQSCVFGQNFYENRVGHDTYYTVFGTGHAHNDWGDDTSYNVFGNTFYNNITGRSFKSNTVGDNMWDNMLGPNCTGNTFAASLSKNNIKSLKNLNLTTATILYQPQDCEVFQIPNGNFKIRYIDNAGATVINDVTA